MRQSAAAMVEGESLESKELRARLDGARSAVVCAFSHLLDLKDLHTGVHSTRLAEWGVRIGREIGLDEASIRELEVAAVLHDIGKIGIPDSILKKPGPLTPAERALAERHAEYGWGVLRGLPGFELASLFVLHHHEAYDGTGYPSKLRGEEIPIGARVVSVIDAFDAMVSSRPYRHRLTLEEALLRLQRGTGSQFDPSIVPAFVRLASVEAEDVELVTSPQPQAH